MRTNVPLVSKRLDRAKDARIPVQLELGLAIGGRFAVVCVHVIGGGGVDPFLDFDFAGAVVDLVGYVCALAADVADLADEENVCYVCAVHLEGGFWEGLRGVEDLLDCYWSEGFVVPVSGLCVWDSC
jgi:hypothetical protein